MSAYGTAIDQTARTIERRAGYFRNQVIIVVAIGAIVVGGAVLMRSAAALWGWLVLVPACGVFFYADSQLLNEWRSQLLTLWIARALDFAALNEAIRANPALPRATTEGMLASLPSAGDLVAEQKVLTPTRQAIAAASLAMHGGRADALLLKTIVSGLLVATAVTAIWMRAWVPLLALVLLVPLPIARVWMRRRREARCEAEVAQCRVLPGFSEADYTRIQADLQ